MGGSNIFRPREIAIGVVPARRTGRNTRKYFRGLPLVCPHDCNGHNFIAGQQRRYAVMVQYPLDCLHIVLILYVNRFEKGLPIFVKFAHRNHLVKPVDT